MWIATLKTISGFERKVACSDCIKRYRKYLKVDLVKDLLLGSGKCELHGSES